jgi:hypothetical protein
MFDRFVRGSYIYMHIHMQVHQYSGGGESTSLASLSAALAATSTAPSSSQPVPGSTHAHPTLADVVAQQAPADGNSDTSEEEDFSSFKEVDFSDLSSLMQPAPAHTQSQPAAPFQENEDESSDDEGEDMGFVDADAFGEVDLDALMALPAAQTNPSDAKHASVTPTQPPKPQALQQATAQANCDACGFGGNAFDFTVCFACQTPRGMPLVPPEDPSDPSQAICSVCGFGGNAPNFTHCFACQSPNTNPRTAAAAPRVDQKSAPIALSSADVGSDVVVFHVNDAIKFSHNKRAGGADLMTLREDIDW